MPSYHLSSEHLMDYAAGALPEPVGVLVATHLALCPVCRRRAEAFDDIGGVLLESLESEPVKPSLRDAVLSKLDLPEPDPKTAVPSIDPATLDLRVPQPLRGYLDGGLDDIDWKSRGPLDEVRILSDHRGITSRMLRIRAGTAMPQHTHEGSELTLVLAGSFTDGEDRFMRGDVAIADASVDHCPAADPGEDCYCFAVNDAPLRLTGSVSRLLNPFLRI